MHRRGACGLMETKAVKDTLLSQPPMGPRPPLLPRNDRGNYRALTRLRCVSSDEPSPTESKHVFCTLTWLPQDQEGGLHGRDTGHQESAVWVPVATCPRLVAQVLPPPCSPHYSEGTGLPPEVCIPLSLLGGGREGGWRERREATRGRKSPFKPRPVWESS